MLWTDPELQHLLQRVQDGVVSRRQIIDLGGTDADIARLRRRRELTQVTRGVFVNHTGPLTPQQRAYAAVLACAPAALGFESALDLPTPGGHIRVVVPNARHPQGITGVRIQTTRHFDSRVEHSASPPRIRYADAAIDTATERDPAGAFTLLAEVLHSRRTTPSRLRAALADRTRVPNRGMVAGLIDDLEAGTCSVLEWEYLRRVERAHRLPRPRRQAPGAATRPTLRDIDYPEFGIVVELDGRLFHDSAAARGADMERDLDSAVAEHRRTMRLGWAQVVDRPCATARKLGTLLAAGGWTGSVAQCPSCGPRRGSQPWGD